MSSPIAKQHKSRLDSLLIGAHKKLAHSQRTGHLIQILTDMIARNGVSSEDSLLDCGCGDMSIAKAVAANTSMGALRCLDVYELPEEKQGDPYWEPYQKYNGMDIPFADNTFTYVTLIDVLHHVNEDSMPHVLSEALRVGKFVILKDHLEYGLLSRLLLLAMDYIGNKGYGVPMPQRYFNSQRYEALLQKIHAHVVWAHEEPISYYSNALLNTVISPRLHFCHCLARKD